MPGASSDMPYPQLPLLSPEQQGLLLAALSSNKRNNVNKSRAAQEAQLSATDGIDPSSLFGPLAKKVYSPPAYQDHVFGSGLFPDYTDSNNTFDADFSTSGPDFPNESPDFLSDTRADALTGDVSEKRKSPEDEDEDEDGDNKRQEGDDKVAKKPGRKLITAEPTTKRKAQNRAAQRAFRERKEKHLRDLEIKVTELEKSSESTNHENGVLKAQVDRLQTELREYRKRLSSSVGTGAGSSPPTLGLSSAYPPKRASSGSSSDFQFDFSKFGGTNPSSTTVPSLNKETSQSSNQSNGRSGSSAKGIEDTLSSFWMPGNNNVTANEFSPNKVTASQVNHTFPNLFNVAGTGEFSFANLDSSLKQQNAGSTASSSEHEGKRQKSTSSSYMSDSNSPGTSSTSPNAASSSCCTSPETQNYLSELTKTPGTTLYGVTENPLEQTSLASNPMYDFQNLDWLSNQNGGQFDPVLFGDYRESQDAIVGGGDFSSGFFEDPYGLSDPLTSDFNFDINNTVNNVNGLNDKTTDAASAPKAPASKLGATLMDQVARCREGETYNDDKLFMPGEEKEEKGFMMTAQTIWSELQACPKFISGDLDIDSLCSELSAKARCSETGMAVPKAVVEKALWRLAGVPNGGDEASAAQTKESQYQELRAKKSTSGSSNLPAQW